MRTGVAISAVCHAGIVAACVVALPFGTPLEAPPEDLIPIELVTIEEVTQVARGEEDGVQQDEAVTQDRDVRQIDISRDAERETETPTESTAPPPPAPEPAPREVAEPAPEPEPAPEAVSEPEPEPEVAEPAPEPEPEIAEPAPEPEPSEEDIAVEDVPTPPARPTPPPQRQQVAAVPPPEPAREPEPEAQDPLQQIIEVDEATRREPTPETPPAPDAPSFDADRIAALLNRAEPTAATAPDQTAPTASIGQTSAFDSGLSMTEIDALRQQISRCWNLPAGAAGAELLIVKLSIQLNPDGSLTAEPELVDVTQSPFSQVAAEAAMRAVAGCQPYALPAEKYDSWRHIVINFDPRAMLGG